MMKFDKPLVKGKFIKRYKRFFTDVEDQNGQILIAHTPNTGSMKTCLAPGWDVLLTYHNDPKRKLQYTLEMSHNGECWIGLNTGRPNNLVKDSIIAQDIKELKDYGQVKSEVKFGDSRIDLFLSEHKEGRPDCFVEIKNVTLKGENGQCLFPDAVSERGQKHLKELIQVKEQGMDAVIFFVVQRTDCNEFAPAKDIDPEYAKLLSKAKEAGVEILVYQYDVSENGIKLKQSLPYKLS